MMSQTHQASPFFSGAGGVGSGVGGGTTGFGSADGKVCSKLKAVSSSCGSSLLNTKLMFAASSL